jgi:rod shape determining protein RodA
MALLLPVGIVLTAGLVTISSISLELFWLQFVWALIGGAALFAFRHFDWRMLLSYRWILWGLYGLAIVLLVAALVGGPVIRNTHSWISFGVFTFQPVELAKLALILVYAQYFSRRHLKIAKPSTIIGSFVLFMIPAALTLLQPDLGSATVLFGIWFGFLLVSGLPRRLVLGSFLLFVLIGSIGWTSFLKDYQRERIVGVFFPEQNALSVNYSTIQAKIAIGSAGLWGKGYGQGPQTQLGFLTEPANDFVLAALIEEWGLVGGLVVIGAFLAFLFRILKIGLLAQHNFEKFIALGAVIVFGLHFLLNAGSTVGLVPVIGVPFPFLSQGGSNLLMSFLLLAIMNSIARET